MKGLILLALLGIAVAERWDATSEKLQGIHIDAQSMRIAHLRHELEELEELVSHDNDKQYNRVIAELDNRIDAEEELVSRQSDKEYNRVVDVLEHRIDVAEEHDCHDHQFTCGRSTGQCVPDILVCDGVNDCDNGHDEDQSFICKNQAPAGRSWSGTANWKGCVTRTTNHMSVLITGNKRMRHFPSRLWVDAVIVDKWTEDHEEVTKTWTSHGFYDYAHHRLVLDPPEGSEKRIMLICDDGGEGVGDCKMVREHDQSVCGHATLLREVH